MANWNYNPNHYEERDFSIIPEGNYRVRISDVTEKIFSSGNEGYEIVLDVAGHSSKLWYRLVLNRQNEKQTNQNLGAFFNSFGIANTQLGNGRQWIGKVGAVRVKHEPYNGNMNAKVHYLISRNKQEDLPPWQDKGTPAPQPIVINDEDLPFN
jgi:hypothetical protein